MEHLESETLILLNGLAFYAFHLWFHINVSVSSRFRCEKIFISIFLNEEFN